MAEPHHIQPISVVLADDDDRFRQLVTTVLEDDGYSVVAQAADAESACVAAGEHAPDVMILDLVMPGADGLSALQSILDDNPGQAVLVISSLFDRAVEHEVVSLGAWYLEKADGLEALEHRIDTIASIARQRT